MAAASKSQKNLQHNLTELSEINKSVSSKNKLPIFKVNLLIKKGEQLKLQVKLIRWLLSSGRFIVVFVELLTISAFVYRYKLDTDLADLQDSIKERVPYIQSLKNDEILIRQVQFQLNNIKQTRNENPNFAQVLSKIALITPKNIKLTSISFDRTQSFPKTSLSISGQTPSNVELSAFVKALQKDPIFAEITLTNISFERQTNFTITGILNGKGATST